MGNLKGALLGDDDDVRAGQPSAAVQICGFEVVCSCQTATIGRGIAASACIIWAAGRVTLRLAAVVDKETNCRQLEERNASLLL